MFNENKYWVYFIERDRGLHLGCKDLSSTEMLWNTNCHREVVVLGPVPQMLTIDCNQYCLRYELQSNCTVTINFSPYLKHWLQASLIKIDLVPWWKKIRSCKSCRKWDSKSFRDESTLFESHLRQRLQLLIFSYHGTRLILIRLECKLKIDCISIFIWTSPFIIMKCHIHSLPVIHFLIFVKLFQLLRQYPTRKGLLVVSVR